MIVGAPITAVGGTVRRLRIWFNHVPDGNDILFLYHSSASKERLFQDSDGFAHVRLKGSACLDRWGRVLFVPMVASIGWNLFKYKPSVALSFAPWTMLATGLATRITRVCGLKARHVIHLAGDPVPPIQAVWRERIYDLLFRLTLRMCDEVVVLSGRMEDSLRSNYKVPNKVQVKVVPISIECAKAEVHVTGAGEDDSQLTFGMVSRLHAPKRCDVGLQAFATVAQNRQVRLLVVGTGSEKSKLKTLAAELGVADRVEFLGWIGDPRDAFKMIDCLLLPSESEGTPRAILEAADVGVPTIASTVGGIPDLIEHGCTGWLIPPGDVGSLTKIMLEIVSRPEVLSEVGARTKAAVQARPSPEDEVREILGAA